VAGWSAGANLAAVLCQAARSGGPAIAGQLLLTPVTDGGRPWPSADENAEGYVLTKPLMQWFWDHYAGPADRLDPRASPLRAEDLSGLPPAVIVTAELDPLRDEGVAYAGALERAGVPTRRLHARGHTHTSLTMVDVVGSGEGLRATMADALQGFFRGASPGPTPR
jgi:acetyl esterase/lipase